MYNIKIDEIFVYRMIKIIDITKMVGIARYTNNDTSVIFYFTIKF